MAKGPKMAQMSMADFAKRFGNPRQQAYNTFKGAMDKSYADEASPAQMVEQAGTGPYSRGALSPLGGKAKA